VEQGERILAVAAVLAAAVAVAALCSAACTVTATDIEFVAAAAAA
jgi:hypothetical protein